MEREEPSGEGTGTTAHPPETPVAHGAAKGHEEDPGQDPRPDDGPDADAGEAPSEASGPDGPQAQGPPESDSGDGDGETADAASDADEDTQGQKERVQELEARIQELEREREDAKNRWMRSRADYDNLVRRTDREREEIRKTASARVISDVLPQVEVLERAAREISEVDEGHAKGIRLAVQSLKAALEKEGLQEVPGEGAPFDPQHHEAVAREESDAPEGTITQVIRPGYRLHDKLLQAALVKVSAGPGEKEAEEASSEASKSPT